MQEENQSNIEQHANRRLQKENMNKRTESFVQEDNQEADDEDDKTLDELIGPNPFSVMYTGCPQLITSPAMCR
ncbi:hypothetical protein CAJAP_04980 [Camponotus japonicus]